MKAMIFAAGLGKRLLPITETVPKVLVPVRERPILGWIVEQLSRNGFDEILINTHYLHGRIEEYIACLHTPGRITLRHEPNILGTGGGLLNTRSFWGEEACYLCNGDILCDLNIPEFIAHHRAGNYPITLATNDNKSPSMLLVDANGEFCGRLVDGKSTFYTDPVGAATPKGFAGIHLVDPSFIRHAHTTTRFSIIDQYVDYIKEGFSISTYAIQDAYWIDIGTPHPLERANREFTGFTDYSPS